MHWNQFLPNIVTSSILNIACWERLWGCRYWFWTAWILLVLCCRIWSCRRHGMGSSARILAGMEWRIPRNRVLIVHGSCRVWTTCCFAVVAKNGCSWNSVTSSAAAKGGHLSVLQWTRANRCDCDERTCSFAAGQTRRGQQRGRAGALENKFFAIQCSWYQLTGAINWGAHRACLARPRSELRGLGRKLHGDLARSASRRL